MLRKMAAAALAAIIVAPAAAQDAYTIGLTGALTGPPASTERTNSARSGATANHAHFPRCSRVMSPALTSTER